MGIKTFGEIKNSDGFIDKYVKNNILKEEFQNSNNIYEKWNKIREFYALNYSYIIQTSKESRNIWAMSYPFDWNNYFSYIEKIAWASIRENGGIILYPQFPAQGFFIDFANPYLKIGLELDSEEFHNEEKDKKRDKKLLREGWKIFRVTSSEANRKYMTNDELNDKGIFGYEKENYIEDWIMNTCDGVVNAIKYWYFMNEDERNRLYSFRLNDIEESDYNLNNYVNIHSMIISSLKKHASFKFDEFSKTISIPNL